MITRSPFITHENASGALWTQGLCSSQGRQVFFFIFFPRYHLGQKDAKEMRSCLWEGPLSLKAPKCWQHLRNTMRGTLCEQSSQPSVCTSGCLPVLAASFRNLSLFAPVCFPAEERGSDQKGQGSHQPTAQSSPASHGKRPKVNLSIKATQRA